MMFKRRLLISLALTAVSFVANAGSMNYAGQVGQADRLTNLNISADTVESQDQVLLTNLKVTYDSSIRGAISDDLRVAKDGRLETCDQICREFGTAGADVCPAPPAEDPEESKDETNRLLAIRALANRLQFKWFPEYKTMYINEVVCNIH